MSPRAGSAATTRTCNRLLVSKVIAFASAALHAARRTGYRVAVPEGYGHPAVARRAQQAASKGSKARIPATRWNRRPDPGSQASQVGEWADERLARRSEVIRWLSRRAAKWYDGYKETTRRC